MKSLIRVLGLSISIFSSPEPLKGNNWMSAFHTADATVGSLDLIPGTSSFTAVYEDEKSDKELRGGGDFEFKTISNVRESTIRFLNAGYRYFHVFLRSTNDGNWSFLESQSGSLIEYDLELVLSQMQQFLYESRYETIFLSVDLYDGTESSNFVDWLQFRLGDYIFIRDSETPLIDVSLRDIRRKFVLLSDQPLKSESSESLSFGADQIDFTSLNRVNHGPASSDGFVAWKAAVLAYFTKAPDYSRLTGLKLDCYYKPGVAENGSKSQASSVRLGLRIARLVKDADVRPGFVRLNHFSRQASKFFLARIKQIVNMRARAARVEKADSLVDENNHMMPVPMASVYGLVGLMLAAVALAVTKL